MSEPPIDTRRDSFMEEAQRQMIAFERREREFLKREKEERAAELHLPIVRTELHS